jgi:hypothetical protein
VTDAQQPALAEWAAEKLETHGKIHPVTLGKSAGKADATDAGKVCGDRENIGKVHLERVIRFFPKAECGFRRGGGDDGVHLGEGLVEIPSDQRSDLLCSQVVGIVVAAAQDIGSQDDPPFDFLAESLGPRLLIEGEKILGLVGTTSVAYPV